MPQGLAVSCIQRHDVSVSIAGECQAGVSCQHASPGTIFTQIMGPAQLARLVIDRLQETFAPQSVICTCPAIGAIGWLREIEAVTRMRIHQKEPRLRIKARRAEVRKTAFIRRNQASIGCRLLCRVRDGMAILVHTEGPVHGAKWHSQQTLAISAIQYKKVAITRCLHEHLMWTAMKISIYKDRHFHCIPIMGIVRRS